MLLRNWASFFPILLCYGVIIIVLWLLLQILSSMLAQNTSRWTIILCVRGFSKVIFRSSLFLPMTSLLIYLQNVCLPLFFIGYLQTHLEIPLSVYGDESTSCRLEEIEKGEGDIIPTITPKTVSSKKHNTSVS